MACGITQVDNSYVYFLQHCFDDSDNRQGPPRQRVAHAHRDFFSSLRDAHMQFYVHYASWLWLGEMTSTGTPNGDIFNSIRASRDCLQQALVQLDRAESADAGRHIGFQLIV